MKTLVTPLVDAPDAELIHRCQEGDRDAFGSLVARHQGLVCAQAYSVCGDLGRSEDVAQEAFLCAWKQLAELREVSKFKSWLCGIARRLALRVVEKRQRERERQAELQSQNAPVHSPHDHLISQEEEVLVWDALNQLPESYRTPLILFYREQQSVSEVAKALDLSEDAVKQRLSRGRLMLKQQVATVVENTLSRSRPTLALTTAVMASIGGVGTATAGAATTAVTMTKAGGATLGAVLLPILGGILGAGVGLSGAWLGVRLSAEAAPYERERAEVLRGGRRMVLGVSLFVGTELIAVLACVYFQKSSAFVVGTVLALTAVYLVWILMSLASLRTKVRAIRSEEEAAGNPIRERPSTGFGRFFPLGKRLEYRSPASFLGLPLVHVLWDNHAQPDPARRTARGWLALGDRATGVIAFGGIARGLIAIGGLAVGPVAFGGIGIGCLSLSGCAIGVWAYGGVAIGMIVHGAVAIASEVALGAFALAREFGLGAFVIAPHLNDAAARSAVSQSWWLQLTTTAWFPLVVPCLVLGSFVLQGWLTVRVHKRQLQA